MAADDALPAWEVRGLQGRVLVVFRGHVTAEDGRASAAACLRALGQNPNVEIVFDVRDVTTYAGPARQVWQELLMPRRGQLGRMTVVSRSRLTRMGASVFAMVLGIDCKALEELPPDLHSSTPSIRP